MRETDKTGACFQRRIRYQNVQDRRVSCSRPQKRAQLDGMTKLLWMHKTHWSTGCVKNFDNIAEKFRDASVGSSHLSADNCLWEQSAEQTVSRASYSQPQHHICHLMTMVIITNKKIATLQETGRRNFHFLLTRVASEEGPIFEQWQLKAGLTAFLASHSKQAVMSCSELRTAQGQMKMSFWPSPPVSWCNDSCWVRYNTQGTRAASLPWRHSQKASSLI